MTDTLDDLLELWADALKKARPGSNRDWHKRCVRAIHDATTGAGLVVVPREQIDILKLCARTFRQYENIHMAKGSVDAEVKARVNAEIAQKVEAMITAHEQSMTDEEVSGG